jgi:quercetin dioxygenase-like cupin family protein
MELGKGSLRHLLLKKSCSIVECAATSWSSGNSTVCSIPSFAVKEFFQPGLDVNVTASLVRINGGGEEPLHFHTSHLVGLVVRGSGVFRWADERGAEIRSAVTEGDLVVIPRGALHFFEATGVGLDYIALELSDAVIDYQKHFLDEGPS